MQGTAISGRCGDVKSGYRVVSTLSSPVCSGWRTHRLHFCREERLPLEYGSILDTMTRIYLMVFVSSDYSSNQPCRWYLEYAKCIACSGPRNKKKKKRKKKPQHPEHDSDDEALVLEI